jgi:hypothetical protein
MARSNRVERQNERDAGRLSCHQRRPGNRGAPSQSSAVTIIATAADAFFAGGAALDFTLTFLARFRRGDESSAAPGPARLLLSAAVGTLTFGTSCIS